MGKTQLQTVCVRTEWCYVINVGFFPPREMVIPTKHGDGAPKPDKCRQDFIHCLSCDLNVKNRVSGSVLPNVDLWTLLRGFFVWCFRAFSWLDFFICNFQWGMKGAGSLFPQGWLRSMAKMVVYSFKLMASKMAAHYIARRQVVSGYFWCHQFTTVFQLKTMWQLCWI